MTIGADYSGSDSYNRESQKPEETGMKEYAIRENHLYQKAYAAGRHAASRSVTVFVLKDRQASRLKKEHPMKLKINRVGLTASKKLGGAVERNRAKRVMREAYRALEQDPGIRKGYLVVIAAREPATVLKMQDVKRDMHSCLARLEMLLPGEQEKKENAAIGQETEENGC